MAFYFKIFVENNLNVLLVFLVLSMHPAQAQTNAVQPMGSGTSADPYQIASLANLSWLSQTPAVWDANFQQTADIDAAETQFWDDSDDNLDGDLYNDPNDLTSAGNNQGFSPIGTSSTNFTGSYTGNGHTISNLQINRPTQDNIGFFVLVFGADIVDVHLTNADITGRADVGTLIGFNISSQVRDCHATGIVNSQGRGGGFIGRNFVGTIMNCFASSTVNANGFAGGLIGKDFFGEVSDSYAMGNVNGPNAGGLIGSSEFGVVQNCFSSGVVSGTSSVGGLVGSSSSFNIQDSFWDTQTTGQATSDGGTGKTTAEMQQQSTFTDAGWDFTAVWHIDGVNNNGYPYLQWQEFDPEVITDAVTQVTATSVTVNATLTNLGFPEVGEHGFQLAPTANFETASTLVLGTPQDIGAFTAEYRLLDQNTTYFVRAFVSDASNTLTYGQTLSFTTLVDNQAPTPSLQNVPAVVNGPFTIELVFDEEVHELIPNPVEVAPADDTRGTATLGAVVAAPEAVYTIMVTPTVAGELVFFNEFAGMAKDLAGNLSNPLLPVTVIYDPVTLAPVINAPLGNTINSGLGLDFTLPENAEEESVQLLISETANPTATITLEFNASVGSAGDYQIALDLEDLASAPEVASTTGGNSLEEGTSYDFTLSYSDENGNPAAATTVQNIVFDTQPPVLQFVSLSSNNAFNTALATVGDEVTLTFESTTPLNGATGSINSTVVSFTNVSENLWQGTLVINESSPEGEVPFELFAMGVNELGTFATATTDGSNVIVDTSAPTPNCQSLTVQLDATGTVSISPQEVDNGSFDENGISDRSLNVTSFGCAHLGENNGVLIITDTAGNAASCEVLITVVDTIAPTVLTRDISLVLDDTGIAQLSPESVDNGSFDNCTITDMQLDQTDFTLANVGENQVRLTVTDSSGNSTTATATVTVSPLDGDSDGEANFVENLSFYPNPTQGILFILVPGLESTVQVQVASNLGITVFSEVLQVPENRELQINLESLASGAYSVFLSGAELEEGFKIIKR